MHRLAGFALAAASLLAVSACSDDDGKDASVQDKLAAAVTAEFKKVDGVKVDEKCVKDAAAKLSDADAQSLLGNLSADPATLAASQAAFLDETQACISVG